MRPEDHVHVVLHEEVQLQSQDGTAANAALRAENAQVGYKVSGVHLEVCHLLFAGTAHSVLFEGAQVEIQVKT